MEEALDRVVVGFTASSNHASVRMVDDRVAYDAGYKNVLMCNECLSLDSAGDE